MTDGHDDLDGRVAVVTGGSRGIGAETARTFAAHGARVALVARDRDGLAAVAAEIDRAGGPRALTVPADCTEESAMAEMAARVTDELGAPTILAAFAGGAGAPVPTCEETAAHWRAVLDSELTSTFLACRVLLGPMVDAGGGAIATMSSSAARQPTRASAAYTAAKAGVIAFTRQLAVEHAADGIRANCIAPATTENDRMRSAMTADQLDALGRSFPLGRIGRPADVARAALFLVSPASAWVTGVTLDVAGGQITV